MAHAGTPTGLAKQPATSGSLNLVFSAVVILAIGLALAMATSFIITNQAASGPAVDRGYDAIEKARGAWAVSAVTVDPAVQKAAADRARAMSGVPADTSYDAVEKTRGGALSGTKIDPSTFDRTPRGAHGQLP